MAFRKDDRVTTPNGEGTVIATELDLERRCTWVEVNLDTPVTQKGCHGDSVTQSVGEYKSSDLKKS